MDVCFFNKLLHIFANMNNVLNNISKNLYLCSVCINTHTHTHTHTHTFSLYVRRIYSLVSLYERALPSGDVRFLVFKAKLSKSDE